MRRAYYGVPLKSAPQRKTPNVAPLIKRRALGLSSNHGKKFYQLKTFFVNLLVLERKLHAAHDDGIVFGDAPLA